MKKKNKNVSKTIPNGRTLQTRDEYFYGGSNYRKPGYAKKGNYRKVVVIDSNDLDDLAVVKLTTSPKGITLDYGNGKSKFKPFVSTLDNLGKPIRVGKKFIENKPNKDVSSKDVAKIKRVSFAESQNSKQNKRLARHLKGRK